MRKHLIIIFLSFAVFSSVKGQSVNGIILSDTANFKIVQVFGNHYQRGFAYGYLCADNIMDIWNNYIKPSYGAYMPFAKAVVGNPANFKVDNEFVVEARGVIDGIAYAGYDTTGIDYLDLFVVNFMTDLEGFFSINGFPESYNCSTLINWGNATMGTDLDGKAVISHFLDALTLNEVISRNQVVVIHFPSEADEQPWLMTGVAGQIVASQALNNNGVVVFLNTVNGLNAQANMEYEPMTITLRKAIEKLDFNGDGISNIEDVKKAINSNQNGYARGFIVAALSTTHNLSNDTSISFIAECASEIPYITYRYVDDIDSVKGVNLYAANNFIKRNNALNFCNRYNRVKNFINNYYDGKNIGQNDNKEIMFTQSTQSSCLQFIQVVPENKTFLMSVSNGLSSAYTQTIATFDYDFLFNYAGIHDFYEVEILKIFPNPSSDYIYLPIDFSENYSCFIYDLSGKIVISDYLAKQNKIEIKDLINGFYSIKLLSNKKIYVGKFLKQ
jgi:hypothetical protein